MTLSETTDRRLTDYIQVEEDFSQIIAELESIAEVPATACEIASIIISAIDVCRRSRPIHYVAGDPITPPVTSRMFTIETPGGTVANFAKLCKLGHILFADRDNHPAHSPLLAGWMSYRASMDYAEDIFSFGVNGEVPNKPHRTEQLRAFAGFGKPTDDELRVVRRIIGSDVILKAFVAEEDRSDSIYHSLDKWLGIDESAGTGEVSSNRI
jgi:hypothetical protein